MKKGLFAVCIAAVTALQTVFWCAFAESSDASCNDEIERLFAQNMSGRGVSGFYDGLTLGGSDWTAFCRARLYKNEDSAEFVELAKRSADDMINGGGFVAPTEKQRSAIVLSAFGECPRELINAAAYCSPDLDKQGLNAWIWGLIAANCSGLEAGDEALYTRLELAGRIIESRLADGGFSLRGESADADVTASAVFALAPLADSETIKEALDGAVSALSAIQLEHGGFLSLGTETCESTAQAVIAFTAAGIADERLDGAVCALQKFRCEDGGYAHTVGGRSDKMSSAQALQAFCALELSRSGERLFDRSEKSAGESADSGANNTQSAVSPPNSGKFSGFHIKLIISLLLGAAALAALVLGLVKRKKSAPAAAAVLAVLAGGVWLLNIQTPDEYYSQVPQNGITVHISVDCKKALPYLDSIDESVNPRSVIPEDGIIIPLCEVAAAEGATAFDALVEAARLEKIRVDYSGSAYGVYVRGIGFVCEFGFGSESGWTYRVNGSVPQESAGAYTLSEGDFVEFIYTCELGRDTEDL